MKVVIVSPHFSENSDVSSSYVWKLAEHLKAECKVTVITLTEKPKLPDGVRVKTVPKSSSGVILFFLVTRALVRSARAANVLYVQGTSSLGLSAIVAGRIAGVPVVVRYTEDEAWKHLQVSDDTAPHQGTFRHSKKIPGSVWGIWHVQHLVLRHADRVLFPSLYLAREMMATHQLHKNRVRVSYTPPIKQTATPLPTRAPHRILMNTPLLPWKDVATALRATSLLMKTHQDVELVVIGDGPERTDLEEIARSQEVHKRVTFLGNMTTKEKVHHIQSAGVFLSTATYEDRPDVLFLAFSEGVPVVATDVPGQREAFEDGVSGLLIPPGNAQTCAAAIERIFSDTTLGSTLAQNAKQKLQKEFSWEEHEKRLLFFFKN